MYEFISGKVEELSPAHIIIDNNGIGFLVNISLQTYSSLANHNECKLYIKEIIREDTHDLYGFFTTHERNIFRHLISVSGVGANTARMILSSLSPQELEIAISTADVNALKKIKGIGLKSAQRIIVELKDKITNSKTETGDIFASQNNTIKDEALSALVMLGFNKQPASKAIDAILSAPGAHSVESVVKNALKML